MVNLAKINSGQALISLTGKTREWILALNAETHTVILNAVCDDSGDTTAPVRSLCEAFRALGANIGAWNVNVTVFNPFQTSVLHQNEVVRASLTNGRRGLLTVAKTARNVRDDCAGLSVFQVVSLSALYAATHIVN